MEITGNVDAIAALGDSLARRILQVVGRQQPIGAVRETSLGRTSLPALKAFLAGEQHYREGRWDSALTKYSEAVRFDSMFALPYLRMALVRWWDPESSDNYLDWGEYARRAQRLNSGLSARDSLLVVVFSGWADLSADVRAPVTFAHLRALERGLGELTGGRVRGGVPGHLCGAAE